MSKEAQAERERRARVILGTAETEIAEKFAQASRKYTDNPVALHLRGKNQLLLQFHRHKTRAPLAALNMR